MLIFPKIKTNRHIYFNFQDQDLKDVEEYLETNDSVEDHANCVLENLPACSGGSSSKCCDNVGKKLKEIGLMVFGPRSSLKECGLLDQVNITDEKWFLFLKKGWPK